MVIIFVMKIYHLNVDEDWLMQFMGLRA